LTSRDLFDLKSIIEDSTKEIEKFEKVRSYIIDISEDELVSRLTDSKIKKIAEELLSRLLPGDKHEDREH